MMTAKEQPALPAEGTRSPVTAEMGGDWPNTTRLLPWLIAAFLVSLWLIPIDATYLPFKLPFDSTIDRFELVGLTLVWLIALASAGPYGPEWRPNRVNVGIAVFLLIAMASVVLNLTNLVRAEELQLAIKKLTVLFCYAIFFVVVATSMRRRELPRFLILMLGLAALTALGTIIEYRTGVNYFHNLAAKLPVLNVEPAPPDPKFGRPSIVGPTQHGLAVATMLSMMVPLAVVGFMSAKRRRDQVLYGLTLALLFAGAVATLRKTALVVPAAALVVLCVYQPRRMLRLLPLGLAMVVLMQVISPGALSGIRYQLEGGDELSNRGRTSDYAAIKPDLVSHPLIGRGYGTYDPKAYLETRKPERHRLVDNQYLLLLIEVGIIGAVAYAIVSILSITMLHRSARSKDFARAGPALALIGSIIGFLVANVLFDTLAFPQVPYLFFCLLGFGVVYAAGERQRNA